MSTFDPLLVTSIVAWTTFTYYQFISPQSSFSKGDRKWYVERARSIPLAPPVWLFGIAWSILYGLMSASIILFTRNAQANSFNLAMGLALYVFHMLANKCWTPVFWNLKDRQSAFAIIVLLMIPSLIGFLLMLVLNGEFHLIPLIFTCIYMGWLLFASYLNYQFM